MKHLVVLLVGLLLLLAGCAGGDDGTTTVVETETVVRTVTVAEPQPPPPTGALNLSVYFLRDGKVAAARRSVEATQAVGAAAARALLEGPNTEERAAGLRSAIPSGMSFRSLSITGATATVRLSSDLEPGEDEPWLAQVVYTLTQFPKVKAARVVTDAGSTDPYTRGELEDVTPAIFIESPVVGESVSSPIHAYGTANTFEANFTIHVIDGKGRRIARTFVTATSGTGTRGTFDVRVSVPSGVSGRIQLVAFEPSAEDGRPLHTVRIPLHLSG